MPSAIALREHDDEPNADGIVVLHDVSWEDYERLLDMRGEYPVPRISYLERDVELMTPSKDHERIKSYIGRLFEAWCIDREIEMSPFGSWTLKKKKDKCGAEPDECYIFGTKPRAREWPQLAIEVVWTRRGIDKLEIYRKFGVEEVWYWRKGVIEAYILARGRFTTAKRSRLFPDLDLQRLGSMLHRDSLTQAVRDFLAATQLPARPH